MGETVQAHVKWIALGIETEEKGIRFYTECARNAKGSAAAFFSFLLDQEEFHLKTLTGALSVAAGNPGAMRDAVESFRRMGVRNPMFDLSRVKEVSGGGTVDMLNGAMRFEKEGISLYTKLSAGTANPDVKSLFSELARQEKEHLGLIVGMGKKFAMP